MIICHRPLVENPVGLQAFDDARWLPKTPSRGRWENHLYRLMSRCPVCLEHPFSTNMLSRSSCASFDESAFGAKRNTLDDPVNGFTCDSLLPCERATP